MTAPPPDHWQRDDLLAAIDAAFRAVGRDPRALTQDDLGAMDHFHGGGRRFTRRLARLAGLRPGMRVLDAGGGLGGPARTLAAEFGCTVLVVDLTPSYVEAGRALAARVGLADRVTFRVGDALALDVGEAAFDVVWTENSGMNIADKEALYAGLFRALRPGGILAFQEPMAGPVQPPHFPQMWARDASASFLRTPDAMRDVIGRAGFRLRAWEDLTRDLMGKSAPAAVPGTAIQRIVMGDALDEIVALSRRNAEEGRIVMTQGVFDKP